MNEDRASRYHRLKRRTSIASMAWLLTLLAGLSVTGASISLRSAAEFAAQAVGGPGAAHATLIVILYAAMLVTLLAAGGVPLAWYGDFLLEHRYGLSTQRPGSWIVDRLKSFGIELLFACGGSAVLYALIRYSPERWWLPAGAVFSWSSSSSRTSRGSPAAAVFARETPRPRVAADAPAHLAERAGARVLALMNGDSARKPGRPTPP